MGAFLVPDPGSLAHEPITADEVEQTDPAQIARILNVYATVLYDQGLCLQVELAAAA